MTEFDTDTALQRIKEARTDSTHANAETPASTEEPSLAAIGARMHNRSYEGDPLTKITDRMFKN